MAEGDGFLPIAAVPPLRLFPAGGSFAFLANTRDSKENFARNGGHPVYGETAIEYRFNSLGYRSAEFDAPAEIRILAIGCSYVMGIGLPERDVFHELFAEQLRRATGKNVVVANLGAPGASNDYIARLLQLAVPLLDPDIVLINFTHAARREYGTVEQQLLNYVPANRPSDRVSREIFAHLEALSSELDDDLNVFRNYKSIEALLRGRTWLFSTSSAADFERVLDHVDRARFVGSLQWADKARDWCHPGPVSHRNLAELYWEGFTRLGGLSSKHAPRVAGNVGCAAHSPSSSG